MKDLLLRADYYVPVISDLLMMFAKDYVPYINRVREEKEILKRVNVTCSEVKTVLQTQADRKLIRHESKDSNGNILNCSQETLVPTQQFSKCVHSGNQLEAIAMPTGDGNLIGGEVNRWFIFCNLVLTIVFSAHSTLV